MHQPQKSNSVSSFVTSSSSGLSLSRQQLNLATSSQVSPGGLGHSSSSSILSQSSLVSNFDDKAYTQNALKQIRNSLQPFATKVANGGHYGSGERRPSSASSNASSCNSASAAATVFGGSSSNGHHQLSASGSSLGPYSTYLHPPSQPGTYLYGQVNKLPTGAASTQICLGAMTPSSHCHQQQGTNTSNGSLNGDTANGSGGSVAPAAMVNVEEQKQLTRQLLEMAGLPEDTLDALSPRDLNLLLGRIYKQLQQSSAVASHNHAQQQPDPAKAEQPPSANQMSSQSQCQSSAPSAHYPNPPLQYHQLPSHPTVIDRMSLYQATPSGTLVNGTGQADSLLPSAVSSTSSSPLFTRDRLQPKILSSNSAQPLTENYRNYLHQKVNQADSGSTGYSTSSSTGSNAPPGASSFSLNTQTHSSSSLASSNSSSTSSNSPYHRMVPTVPQKGTNGHLTTAPEPSGGGISGPHEAATAAATSIALQKRLLATKLAAQSNPAGVASFRPTDPLPPPPLPPHRDTTKAPVPPPIPPHSSTFHSKSEVNQASSARATSALASAVANSPQLQQFLRQHLATLDTASATENLLLRSPTQPQIKSKPRPGALSYASSASSASPPQREQSSSPVSFGRARLKAAALAAAEQHQTNGNSSLVAGQNGLAQQQPEVTPKLINNGTGNLFNGQVDPLLAAQVSQKLANLNLSRTGTNYHHVNSPPPSYAASSSSGLQSPTPTMSSSSDYACTPTRQTGSGLPYGAAALHHKLSPMASVSHSHTARGPPSSQHNGARDSLSSSALGSAVSSTMVSPSPSDGDQTTHSQANLTAWASRHAVSQSPIIMQSVKSQKVQKPVLQTAVAPTLPPINPPPSSANSTLKGPLFGHRDGAPTADSYAAMQSVSSKLAPLNANCSNLSSSLPSPASSTASSLKSTSIKLPDQCGLNPPPYANGYNGQGRFSSASSTTSATPSNTNDASDGYHACPPPPYASAIVRTNGANLAPANAATANKLGPNSGQSPPPPPPPPYSISLSIAQQDSIAQIFSNFTSPPPPSNFGGSNSSVTSSSTAGAAQKTGGQCFQVPTTDPPSYASSMAALAAQRSATLSSGSSSTTSTNVYSPAASSGKWPREANNNNSAIASSSSLQSATAVAVAVSMASHRPLPLGPASRSSAFHSEPPDTEVPPLPPKPSASGSSNAPPPPPLPPQPLHIQAAAIAAGQKMHSEASAQEGNLESAKEGAKEGGDQFGDFDQHFTAEHRLLCEMIKQEDGSEDLIEKDADGSMRKQTHCSPIPTRRNRAGQTTLEKEVPRVTPLDASAFKFYMEQHMENLTKAAKERQHRSDQLEAEIQKANLTKEAADEMRKMLLKKESNHIRLRRAKMDRTMFRKIKTIGVGAFGEVALVRKTDVNVLYAMKRLRKADVLTRKQVAHVKAERDILAEADNEWVVKLYYSFQDEKYLYFVMDYIPGGDLMSLLIKWNLFSEDLARFYIAELVLAVESVHKMGFIHRDIKPDNVLIDKDGHIKLTDFGLCTGFRWTHDSKYYHERGAGSIDFDSTDGGRWSSSASNCNCPKNGKETDNGSATGGALSSKPLERRKHRREHHRCEAHSLVGTPNYIAPEVLLQIGYTQGCDWWSVGVILHEMVVGSPPFYAATPAQTQQKVINWRNTLRIPPQARLSAETADLITKLCCDAEDRLGRNGADEIKAHPFFESINFDAGLRNQRAPYIPDIKHAMDTSNFDPVPPKLHDSDDSTDDTDSEAESQSFDQFGRPVESPDRAQPRTTKGKPKPAVPVDPKHPQHAFLEFTFRRFFDNAGNAYQMAHFAPGGGSDAGSGSGTHAPASSPSAEIYGGSLAESNMSENTTTTTTSSNIDGEFIYDEVYSSTSSISVTVATASNAHAPVSPLPSAPLICAPAYLTTGSSTSVAATSVLQPDAAVASTIHSSASPPAPLISSSSPLPPPPFEGSSSSTTSLINAIIKDHRSAATATAAPAATGSTTEPTNDPVFV